MGTYISSSIRPQYFHSGSCFVNMPIWKIWKQDTPVFRVLCWTCIFFSILIRDLCSRLRASLFIVISSTPFSLSTSWTSLVKKGGEENVPKIKKAYAPYIQRPTVRWNFEKFLSAAPKCPNNWKALFLLTKKKQRKNKLHNVLLDSLHNFQFKMYDIKPCRRACCQMMRRNVWNNHRSFGVGNVSITNSKIAISQYFDLFIGPRNTGDQIWNHYMWHQLVVKFLANASDATWMWLHLVNKFETSKASVFWLSLTNLKNQKRS